MKRVEVVRVGGGLVGVVDVEGGMVMMVGWSRGVSNLK